MNKAVVTLLIRSFRCGQAAIAHYLYAISYYIIVVTGGGCFERTEISFIPFQGRIQRSVAITYPFEEQPDSTKADTPMGLMMFSVRCFQPRKESSKSNISKHEKRPPTLL